MVFGVSNVKYLAFDTSDGNALMQLQLMDEVKGCKKQLLISTIKLKILKRSKKVKVRNLTKSEQLQHLVASSRLPPCKKQQQPKKKKKK